MNTVKRNKSKKRKKVLYLTQKEIDDLIKTTKREDLKDTIIVCTDYPFPDMNQKYEMV